MIEKLEEAYKAALIEREIACSICGMPIVPHGARQLIVLLRGRFECREKDGAYAIRPIDGPACGMTMLEYLTAELGKPEYAHFFKA